jgi:hypothetical protein
MHTCWDGFQRRAGAQNSVKEKQAHSDILVGEAFYLTLL